MILPAEIIRTGRAIMSALQPLTGQRAFGQLRLRAKPGKVVRLPAFTYFTPVQDGDQHPHWFFKLPKGPNEDDSWVVDDSGNVLVDAYSNLGGNRFNVPANTRFVPDLPIEDLDVSAATGPRAEADFAGGADAQEFGGVRDMGFYEQLGGPALTVDLTRSPLRHFPAVLLAFTDLEPADGASTSQLNQLNVSAGRNTRMFKVGYSLSIIVSRDEGDQHRRHEGLWVADQMVTSLVEINAAPDGELISNPGGLQIKQLMRESGDQKLYQKFYIYTMFVSAMVPITRCDRRTFQPWLSARLDVDRPRDAEPATPEQVAPYELVNNVLIDMTPGQLDLAIDGTFARASAGTLFRDGQLQSFGAGERRVLHPSRGLYMEPEVGNPLGAAAQDLTQWTPSAGVTVSSGMHADPFGNLAAADSVQFPAGSELSLSLAGQAATLGEPIVFCVFARAVGPRASTKFRLGLHDGLAEISSGDFTVGSSWQRIRWKVVPQGGVVTLRLKNQSDGQAHQVVLWGASFDNDARWGAEYAFATKLQDELEFRPYQQTDPNEQIDTPLQLLKGKWTLRWSNDEVPCNLLGLGLSPAPRLASVGDGATDLVALELYGVPASGGAQLVLRTRADGVVVNLSGLRWPIGKVLEFTVDALGVLTIRGTDGHDGDYPFPAYDGDAVLAADYLVIGGSSTGGSPPTPGFFAVVAVA